MTTKEKMIHVAEDLPIDATIEDAMDRFLFLAKIEKGLEQVNRGQSFSHSEVNEKRSKWLK